MSLIYSTHQCVRNLLIVVIITGFSFRPVFAQSHTFSDPNFIAGTSNGLSDMTYGDFDGDGDLDIAIGTRTIEPETQSFGWFENVDGNGLYFPNQNFFDPGVAISSLSCGDLDGDGDMDILAGSYRDDRVYWLENLDGAGNFSDTLLITDQTDKVQYVDCVDVDGDGDLDVLSASTDDDKIAWYENLGEEGFGPQQIISIEYDDPFHFSFHDFDDDDDLDLMVAFFNSDAVILFENIGGDTLFNNPVPIVEEIDGVNKVLPSDIDGDNDMDIIVYASIEDTISWVENVDGSGTTWEMHTIAGNMEFCYGISIADMDGDGDPDLYGTKYNDGLVFYWENIDGSGTFADAVEVGTGSSFPYSLYTQDIDSDDDLDLVISYGARGLVWFDNIDGLGTLDEGNIIAETAWNPFRIVAGDIDSDGDQDIVFISNSDRDPEGIWWLENINGQGDFGTKQLVTTEVIEPESIDLVDLDGDDDLDIVSASKDDNKVAWYENIDGAGQFGPQNILTSEARGANIVIGCDMDGDNDNDVVFMADMDHIYGWFENLDGAATFAEMGVLSDEEYGSQTLAVGDIDGDGDLDMVCNSVWDQEFRWHRHQDDGMGFDEAIGFGSNIDRLRHITCADIDMDGDLDVVSAENNDNLIRWSENTDGLGTFAHGDWVDGHLSRASWVTCADVDNDGDLDLLGTSPSLNLVVCYENLDGDGTFGDGLVLDYNAMSSSCVAYADIDGDGVGDVIATYLGSGHIAWYRNETIQVSVGENQDADLPTTSEIIGVYPNPFNPSTTISFSLEKAGQTRLAIYTIAGRLQAVLVDGIVAEGVHEVIFDGSDLASGAYFVRMETASGIDTRKTILLK